MAQRARLEAVKENQEFLREMDKTLFDFDDEIDNLTEVSERYQPPVAL